MTGSHTVQLLLKRGHTVRVLAHNYVMGRGLAGGATAPPEVMDLREFRSNSQIPTLFPNRFPVKRVDFGGCGRAQRVKIKSTSKMSIFDIGCCGPPQPATARG